MKLLGKIVLAVFALMIFTSVTLWILAKNINPETIKQLVNNQINTLTHKNTRINGSISWQIFPRPGLKFNKILIGDEQSNESYSLEINTLLLNLKITPLLRGNFVFSEVNIDGLKLKINRDNSQKNNSFDKNASSIITKESPDQQFAIQRLLVSNGQIIIQQKGQATVFKNLQMGIEQFNLVNVPFPIQIKAQLSEAGGFPKAKANINFKGRLSLNPNILNELQNGITKSSAEGRLLIQNILLNQFSVKKISANLKTYKDGIKFNPFTLSLYNGESIGDMNYIIASQQLLLNQTATNLDGKQLMSALIGHEALSGNMDYSVHATIPLELSTIEQIKGKGTITLKDGEIYNINLNQLLTGLREKLNILINGIPIGLKKSILAADWDKSKTEHGNTAFRLANVQYKLDNGRLNTESLLLQTDSIQVNGEGLLNLTNHEISSRLRASVNTNNTDSALQQVQEALGGYFPLLVSGTIQHPVVLPDFNKINPILNPLLIKTTLEKPLKIIETPLNELLD